MQNFLKVKLHYEDSLRMIPATDAKIEQGRLRVYEDNKLVAEFPQDKVECWFGWVSGNTLPARAEALLR